MPNEKIIQKPFHWFISRGGWRPCGLNSTRNIHIHVFSYYISIMYVYINYLNVGYCTLKTDRKLKLMKLQDSQDINAERSMVLVR